MRRIPSPASLMSIVLLLVAGVLAYHVARDRIAAAVYRGRLAELHERYSALATRYNAAVTRAAVTELRVTEDSVAVVVRTPAGVLQAIPTPCDPTGEVFVDYAVLDGRLWIRRVFDEHTPPSEGVLIDPALAHIDWDEDQADHGKVAYRSLAPGRWLISVSGDGSLALRPARDDVDTPLVAGPEVQDYDPVAEATADIEKISVKDVLSQVFVKESGG